MDNLDTSNGARPRFMIINADHARLERPGTAAAQMVTAMRGGNANYQIALRARAPRPWPWLPGAHAELTGDRTDVRVVSFLRNVNPTIEVFERR